MLDRHPECVAELKTVEVSTVSASSHAQSGRQFRAATYARVSTHNGQKPEMQLEEVREYCGRRGWSVSGEYVDTGISGSREHRPELDRLLSECRRRRVDAVVVYRYAPGECS